MAIDFPNSPSLNQTHIVGSKTWLYDGEKWVLSTEITLGTDTAGNYVSDVTAGTGVTVTHTPGEGSSPTIAIGQAVATTSNPTFAGVTADAVQVGITAAGEIDTSTGNLTIDSAGGTTTIDDNLVVSGNLTVSGTTTTVNTATLSIADNIVTLNSDFTSGAPTENAGIEVLRGASSTVAVRWNETNDKWETTNDGTTYGNIVTTADSGTVTSAMIADGAIVNADVNASAAIAHSKLANATAGQVLLGTTTTGVVTATTISGDITIDGAGTTAIGSGVIVNADVNASAAIAHSKLANATSGQVLLGTTTTGVVTATTVSGDVTIDGAGVTAIASGVIVNADINASAAIALTKLASDTTTALGIGTVELGHASDTTLSRASAGRVAVEGVNVVTVSSTDTLTNKTLTSPVISTISNTGTLTLPTSTDTLVGRATTDTLTNKTLTTPIIDNPKIGYTTTATAAGTTTLTSSSNYLQFFTGTTTQTVTLPVASTMTLGQGFEIHNNSTGTVTIQSSGANTVATLEGGKTATIICILTSGTAAASWDADFTGSTTNTGTGALVFATSPTLVTPNLGTPTALTLTNATGLPVSGITASTTTALGVGSLEVGHATDTTISRVSAGQIAVEGVNVPTISSTDTLSNKSISLGSNTVTGTKAQFDTAVTDDNFAYLGASQTFTNNMTVSTTSAGAVLSVTNAGAGNSITASGPVGVTGATTVRAASTQDGVIIQGRAGGTASYAVTLTPTTLSASRTLTLPDTAGTVVTTGDTGSVTSTMLADGTIVNADINASAAISLSKLATATAAQIVVYNASGVPTATTVSGDISISSTGVVTLTAGSDPLTSTKSAAVLIMDIGA